MWGQGASLRSCCRCPAEHTEAETSQDGVQGSVDTQHALGKQADRAGGREIMREREGT